MTPDQFCIWLSGYASAKPEALDDNVREALMEIIVKMTADKLRGITGVNISSQPTQMVPPPYAVPYAACSSGSSA